MPQRPYKYLTEFYKGKIQRLKETTEYIHTQTDSFITWIIGFSFSGLLVLVSDLNTYASKVPSKSILICLFICIVLGIVFRYISYLITMFQKSLDDYYHGLFSEFMTPITIEDDIQNMNFEELHDLIRLDFDVVLPVVSKDLMKSEEPKLRAFYTKEVDVSRQEFEFAINHLAELDETAYKIKKEKTLQAIQKGIQQNGNIGYNQALWFKIRGWLFTLCLLSFLVAVFILCISLLLML